MRFLLPHVVFAVAFAFAVDVSGAVSETADTASYLERKHCRTKDSWDRSLSIPGIHICSS